MKCKLGDICTKIGSGATPRGGKDAYCDKGITLIRSQNVLDFSFSDNGLAFINEEQAAKLNNVEILSGDVLLNITGDSVARACVMDDSFLPARVNQHVTIIRGKNDVVINRYLLYFLQWQKNHLLQLASGGATRNALTKGMIEQLEIELPSLEQQKNVVAILGSLDNKIALNNKINDNLERQAQAIYKSWFVDFLPFGGTKPRTWIETDIYTLANIIYGAPFKSKQFNTDGIGIPIIRIRDLKEQQFATYTTEVHPKGYLLQPGDIVVFQTDDQFVSHRIVEINDSGIVTKGDANENNDPNLVSYSAVRGVLSSVHIAFVGYFVWFINSYLLPIVLAIALILVLEFLFSNTRTFDINKEGRDKNEK